MTAIETMLRRTDASTSPTRNSSASDSSTSEHAFADVLAGASNDRDALDATADPAHDRRVEPEPGSRRSTESSQRDETHQVDADGRERQAGKPPDDERHAHQPIAHMSLENTALAQTAPGQAALAHVLRGPNPLAPDLATPHVIPEGEAEADGESQVAVSASQVVDGPIATVDTDDLLDVGNMAIGDDPTPHGDLTADGLVADAVGDGHSAVVDSSAAGDAVELLDDGEPPDVQVGADAVDVADADVGPVVTTPAIDRSVGVPAGDTSSTASAAVSVPAEQASPHSNSVDSTAAGTDRAHVTQTSTDPVAVVQAAEKPPLPSPTSIATSIATSATSSVALAADLANSGPVVSANAAPAASTTDTAGQPAPAATGGAESAASLEGLSPAAPSENVATTDVSPGETTPPTAGSDTSESAVDPALTDVAADGGGPVADDTVTPATPEAPRDDTPTRSVNAAERTESGAAEGEPPAEDAAPLIEVQSSADAARPKPAAVPAAVVANTDGADAAALDNGADGAAPVSEARNADPKTVANPSARLAEQVAVRELFDRIDRQRLLRDGTLEFDISTERYGVLRVGAVDGGDGVQLSLQGDGASRDDLAELAEDLRRAFAEDGDDRSSVDVKDGSDPRSDTREPHDTGRGDTSHSADESIDSARPHSAGTSGLDLRL